MLKKLLIILLMPVLVGSCTTHKVKQPSTAVRSNSVTAINPNAYEKAYHHFYSLAQEGDVIAQLNIGRMLIDGRGVAVDNTEALKWFQKAAAQGNVEAKVSLGALYWFAMGTEKKSQQACKLFKRSWQKGNQEGGNFYKRYC